jgi:hypothetical protein
MGSATMTIVQLMILLGQVFAAPGAAEADAPVEKGSFKRWLDYYTEQAAEYEFSVGPAERRVELQATPVLQYSNPVRPTDQHGAVYVWTLDGRPEVVGSIWSSEDAKDPGLRGVAHEFQSLSLDSIVSEHPPRTGRKGPVPDWKTSAAGIELQVLPDAPAAAKSAPGRLSQMRRLAAGFSAQITKSDVESAGGLRLLTNPLLRYSSDSAKVLDGGLFAFVQATDPELLLLIELRETKDGPRWQYAAARFTNRPLLLTRGDRKLWTCEKAEAYVGHNPYFLYWGVGRRSSTFE